MIRLYYDLMFALSLALMLFYVLLWHKHTDPHITLVFMLVPIVNLAHCMLCRSQTLGEALLANKIIYIGGCYLFPIIMLSVFSLCRINVVAWIRVLLFAVSTAIYACVLSIGKSPIFYKSVELAWVDGLPLLVKVYGPAHASFYGLQFACLLMSLTAMGYTYANKNQVSRKLIYLLFLPVALCLVSFFGGRRVIHNVELLPAAYDVAMITYVIIVRRMCLYDITDTAIDTMVQAGDTGFISFDLKLNYLGSNGTAKVIFPELHALTVDLPATGEPFIERTALRWLERFRADEDDDETFYERNDRIYLIRAGYLYDGRRKRGYQLFITDDTADRQYINLLNNFNAELKTEVAEKTAHIVEMHDKLVLGMATMVESRDNSTGGHIRRTSEGVRLLTAEIMEDGRLGLSEEFCRDLIKAAPMHDLGKIAVDDAVLRKPGRFTPEEFEKMKAHAAEGARIVREILTGVEDDGFRRIAENVAHYHHERWNGSGYPDGLAGEEIPIEARIMAIADVYDALVSKRVYKDSMSFDQAHSIIMEGMGMHFDPGLEPYYLAAKPKLEAYYTEVGGGN